MLRFESLKMKNNKVEELINALSPNKIQCYKCKKYKYVSVMMKDVIARENNKLVYVYEMF